MGSATADSSGRFVLTVSVPADAPAGQHHFEAEGAGPNGDATTLVAAIRVGTLKGHGSWVLPAVMVAVTMLLSAGAWVATTIFPRRRRLTPSP
jgi:hypothetical protein